MMIESENDPLLVAVSSARICIERFRVRTQSTDLLSTALRELDDAMDLLATRAVAGWTLNDAIIDALRAEPEGPDPQRLWQAVEAWQAAAPARETTT